MKTATLLKEVARGPVLSPGSEWMEELEEAATFLDGTEVGDDTPLTEPTGSTWWHWSGCSGRAPR